MKRKARTQLKRTSCALILLIGICSVVFAAKYNDEAQIRAALKPFEGVTIIDSKHQKKLLKKIEKVIQAAEALPTPRGQAVQHLVLMADAHRVASEIGRKDSWEQAERHYKRAIELEADSPSAIHGLMLLYSTAGMDYSYNYASLAFELVDKGCAKEYPIDFGHLIWASMTSLLQGEAIRALYAFARLYPDSSALKDFAGQAYLPVAEYVTLEANADTLTYTNKLGGLRFSFLSSLILQGDRVRPDTVFGPRIAFETPYAFSTGAGDSIRNAIAVFCYPSEKYPLDTIIPLVTGRMPGKTEERKKVTGKSLGESVIHVSPNAPNSDRRMPEPFKSKVTVFAGKTYHYVLIFTATTSTYDANVHHFDLIQNSFEKVPLSVDHRDTSKSIPHEANELVSSEGDIDYTVSELTEIRFGDRRNEMPLPVNLRRPYFGPRVFDVDTSGRIFIYDGHNSGLHCYDLDGKNIWRRYLDFHVLDFKYRQGSLYLFTGDSLKVFSASDFKQKASLDFAKMGLKVGNVGGISKFTENALLLADFTTAGFKPTYRYMLNLDSLAISKEMADKTPVAILRDCNPDDIGKLDTLLFKGINDGYSLMGQSHSYIIVGRLYQKEGEDEYTAEYYGLRKRDLSIREFKGFPVDVHGLSARPFFAVNDTTFIVNENRYDESTHEIKATVFHKLVFDSW